MRGIAAAVSGFLLTTSAAWGASGPTATGPNLAACPRVEQAEGWEHERTKPLPVPAALRGVLAADFAHYAVKTLGRGTVCADTSFIGTVEDLSLTPDGRFLSYGWLGYETYGHIVIDRVGKGQVIEVGAKPVFSPSRRHFAAADQTESEFGSLSGLAVWRVDPARTTEIGRINEFPRMQDWRIDSWSGESCINLSAVPLDLPPEQAEKARRTRYRAGPGKDGWHLSRNPRGCAG